MKKILKIIILSTISISPVLSETQTLDPGNMQKAIYPLLNIIKTTQWDLFMTEFEMKADWGTCGKGFKKAIGFKAHMIEPIGYFETSQRRLDFLFAGFKIDEGDANEVDTGTDYGDKTMLSSIDRFMSARDDGEGSNGRGNSVWSHFIYAPIFGLLFKKKLKFLCLSNGDIALPLLSEFFPPYTNDVVYINMIAPMAIMFSPQGLISSILNCGSTMAVNTMHGFVSGVNGEMEASAELNTFIDDTNALDPNNQDAKANKNPHSGFMDSTENFLNGIRNTMYWNVGCLGFAPVGGYVPGADPGGDNELIGYGMMNLLHGASSILPKPILGKQTNFLMSGIPKAANGASISALDSMCKPRTFPMMIESQYYFQRAGIPTTGDAHVTGASTAVTTVAANTPTSADGWVNVVWMARDYYAFAYQCPK